MLHEVASLPFRALTYSHGFRYRYLAHVIPLQQVGCSEGRFVHVPGIRTHGLRLGAQNFRTKSDKSSEGGKEQ